MSGSRPAPYAPGLLPKMRGAGPPRVGARRDVRGDVLRQRVVVLVARRGELHRVVEQLHDVREGVAEEAGDAQGHVDARAAELLARHELEAGDAAGRLVPDRPHAEQPERLGDVVAGGAHRAGAPDHEPDRDRVLAVVGDVALEQRVAERAGHLPRAARRDRLGVDRVEVAAGRQHADEPAGRRAGRPGRHEAAGQAVQQVVELVGGLREARHDLLAGEAQHRLDVGERPVERPHDAGHGVRRPARLVERRDQPARQHLQLVGLPAVVLDQPVGRPERAAQAGQRAGGPAPGLLRAQHAEHEVDPRLPHRRLAEHVQAVADEDVLDLAEVAVDVQDELVEARRRQASLTCAGRGAAAPPAPGPRSARAAPAAWPGPSPAPARTRRAAARAAPSRRRTPRAPSAARGGRRRSRVRGAWPGCPHPGR